MSHSVLLSKNQQFIVVVPAAGVGKRMLSSCPKQYLTIDGQTILSHTVNRLLSHKNIAKVVLALSDDDEYFSQTTLVDNPNIIRVSGGKERVDSVLSGLQVINDAEWVLVHDAARPCFTTTDLTALLKLAEQGSKSGIGGILATPVRDTMKRAVNVKVNGQNIVAQTESREHLWHALTPQFFAQLPPFCVTRKRWIMRILGNRCVLGDPELILVNLQNIFIKQLVIFDRICQYGASAASRGLARMLQYSNSRCT